MNCSLPLLILLLVFSRMDASLTDHLKSCETKNRSDHRSIRNVDFIYVINLDIRPERWKNVQRQLSPYGIFPYRFSAIYGWALPAQVLNDVGILYMEGMQKCPNPLTYASYFCEDFSLVEVDLNKDCYGKKFISHYFRRGAIGCFLSHLSVLADAYQSGYETIWIMEDDIFVCKNPHQISELIDKLDQEVGKEMWDLLYTEEGYYPGFQDDRDKDLPQYAPSVWRPDLMCKDTSYLIQHDNIGKDFIKVGLKEGTRSMIIRRQGIKKILDYAITKGIFLPIDVELAFIPFLNKFTLKTNIVASGGFSSDTSEYRD